MNRSNEYSDEQMMNKGGPLHIAGRIRDASQQDVFDVLSCKMVGCLINSKVTFPSR